MGCVVSDHSRSAEVAAAAKGLVVVLPGPCELFVDIDCAEDLVAFEKSIAVLDTDGAWTVVRRPSPSGRPGRFHVVITLERPVKDAFERIMLQAILGSDRLHESLSYQAAARGVANPTVFFERPETATSSEVTP